MTVTQPEARTNLCASSSPAGARWFCLSTQAKREAAVAAHLRADLGLEVYLPRIRFRRPTRQGPMWTTESLFPGYLFAHFDLTEWQRRVHHARGARGIVHFGNQWPCIPTAVMQALQASVGADQVHIIEEIFEPGDRAAISGGPFNGLHVVVTRVMPSRQRVAVLLEFLGRQSVIEVPAESLVRQRGLGGRPD